MNFHDYFFEALTLKTVKTKQLTRNNSGAYKLEILDKVFKGKDRLVLPITIDDIDQRKASPLITKIFNKIRTVHDIKQISLDDYIKGVVYKRNDPHNRMPHKIGKLLHKIAEESLDRSAANLLVMFRDDPMRSIKKKNDLFVIFSRHPYDVAGMSTDRNWTSCMNLGGKGIVYGNESIERENMAYVATDIEKGSIVAYLVTDDDRHDNGKLALRRPLSRILMKPCYNIYDKTDKAYTCGNMYGIENDSFFVFVDKWVMENLNKDKEDKSYVLHKGLYYDGERGVGFELVPKTMPITIALQNIIDKSKTHEQYLDRFAINSNSMDNSNILSIDFHMPIPKELSGLAWNNRKPYTELVDRIVKCSAINPHSLQKLYMASFGKNDIETTFRLDYIFRSSSSDAEDDINSWEKILQNQLHLQNFNYEDTVSKLKKVFHSAVAQHENEKEQLITAINSIFDEPDISRNIEKLKELGPKTKKVLDELLAISKGTNKKKMITNMYEFVANNPDKEFAVRLYKNTFLRLNQDIQEFQAKYNAAYFADFTTINFVKVGEVYKDILNKKLEFSKEIMATMSELHPTNLFSFAYFDETQYEDFYKKYAKSDFRELQSWLYTVADHYMGNSGAVVAPFGDSYLI